MRFRTIDPTKEHLVVAEIGNNHEGDIILAKEMITAASESRAHAVKFQTFIPEHLSGGDTERLKRLRSFQLNEDNVRDLADLAAKLNIAFFSTPFDPESARFLNNVQGIFKIASCDNDYDDLISEIASFQKPIMISTGLADAFLIDKCVSTVSNKWQEIPTHETAPWLALLHCVSSYPTPADQANLKAIPALKQRYPNLVIGYSDHTLGIHAAIVALSYGAQIVEKHFTLNKHQSDFRDHLLSADPNELTQLTTAAREVTAMNGSGHLKLETNEVAGESAFRRSAAAARYLSAGTALTVQDMIWIRPGTGIRIENADSIIGRTLRQSVEHGELIDPSNLT